MAEMQAAPGFEGVGMVYREGTLALFAFHEWVAPPAQLLATLLQRSLSDTGAFAAVLPPDSAAQSDWRLETGLIRLQHDFASRPSQVRMSLRAVLLDGATRRVIATREFDEQATAPSDDPAGGVLATRRAARRVLAALAAWCAGQVPGRSEASR